MEGFKKWWEDNKHHYCRNSDVEDMEAAFRAGMEHAAQIIEDIRDCTCSERECIRKAIEKEFE